jgi:hypothetical protein
MGVLRSAWPSSGRVPLGAAWAPATPATLQKRSPPTRSPCSNRLGYLLATPLHLGCSRCALRAAGAIADWARLSASILADSDAAPRLNASSRRTLFRTNPHIFRFESNNRSAVTRSGTTPEEARISPAKGERRDADAFARVARHSRPARRWPAPRTRSDDFAVTTVYEHRPSGRGSKKRRRVQLRERRCSLTLLRRHSPG